MPLFRLWNDINASTIRLAKGTVTVSMPPLLAISLSDDTMPVRREMSRICTVL